MKKKIVILLLIALLIGSCSEGSLGREELSRPVDLCLSFEIVAPESPDHHRSIGLPVDEGFGEDYQVRDFWVLQYCGEALVGEPVFVRNQREEETYLTLRVPQKENVVYDCIVVANTDDPALFDRQNAATLSSLKQLARQIRAEEDLYQTYPDGTRHLLMNGSFTLDVTQDGGSMPPCRLSRSIVRLVVILENGPDSGLTLQSVRLCNLQDNIYYTDGLYSGMPEFPPVTGKNILDLPEDKISLPEGSGDTLVYYLPRNCRGSNGSVRERDKNIQAPEGASFVEIRGVTDDGRKMRYRFYPGKNMTDNFDLVPNYNYVLPLVFHASGNPSADARVEDLGPVTLPLPESNCYLLHPGQERLLHIPVTRINRLWQHVSAGPLKIRPDTEWVAEVIWQDIDCRVIRFCDAEGRTVHEGNRFTGKGEEEISLCYLGEAAEGNVLIGIRPADAPARDRTYWWSWHLWITAYDPDARPAGTSWVSGKYTYTVPGGRVCRYDDRTIAWGMDYSNPWSATARNRYIMDRELGAAGGVHPDNGTEDVRTWGLYYQYGRKDPFPRGAVDGSYGNAGTPLPAVVLYGIDGRTSPDFTPTGGDCIRIQQTVKDFITAAQFPYVFYTGAGSGGDWAHDNPCRANPWNGIEARGKSIFDPCPPGWKIPDQGTFDIFAMPDSYSANALQPDYKETDGAGYDFYMNDERRDGTDWYPASGYRNGTDGKMFCIRKEIWLWALLFENDIYNQQLPAQNFKSGFVMTQLDNNTPRNRGVPIRCVQE